MGSNMGDRAQMMHWAIQQLNKHGLQVLRCSSLYETAPAYVTDQPAFLNAAVLVRTVLTPLSLLSILKSLESKAGRDLGGLRWGPRPLDLDIIFYGAGTYKDSKLEIPHPRWSERSFVTVPVSDLWYDTDARHTAFWASSSSPPSVSSSSSSNSSDNDNHARDSSSSSSGSGGSSGSKDSSTRGNSSACSSSSSSSSSNSDASGRSSTCSSSSSASSDSCRSMRPSDASGSAHVWLSRAVQLVRGAASPTPHAHGSLLSHTGSPSSSSPPHIPHTPLNQTHASQAPPMSAPLGPTTHAAAATPDSTPDQRIAAPASPASSTQAPPSSSSSAAVAVEGGQVMRRVMPVGRGGRTLVWGSRTHIMGILNVTPDSFSDGGRFMDASTNDSSNSSSSNSSAWSASQVHGNSQRGSRSSGSNSQLRSGQGSDFLSVDVDLAVQAALAMVSQGADIIDIGGQSTRPGAIAVSTEEEAARVVPVIRALKASPQLGQALISIDTYRAEVARQAVEAGADMVNDVSGGTLDASMLSEVAALGVPYVLMHMRGDPTTMASPPHTHYECVWREVGLELQAAVDRAVQAGIPAWSILLDPGIGFAKSAQGSLELIRHLARMRQHCLQGAACHAPVLVGPSRKRFLAHLTGRTPSESDVATAAAVVALIGQGADLVRIHNVALIRDAVLVADAVHRG